MDTNQRVARALFLRAGIFISIVGLLAVAKSVTQQVVAYQSVSASLGAVNGSSQSVLAIRLARTHGQWIEVTACLVLALIIFGPFAYRMATTSTRKNNP
jgi:hypothetical protein